MVRVSSKGNRRIDASDGNVLIQSNCKTSNTEQSVFGLDTSFSSFLIDDR